jgi:hypothetical protein
MGLKGRAHVLEANPNDSDCLAFAPKKAGCSRQNATLRGQVFFTNYIMTGTRTSSPLVTEVAPCPLQVCGQTFFTNHTLTGNPEVRI